jgi:hypothetical protein
MPFADIIFVESQLPFLITTSPYYQKFKRILLAVAGINCQHEKNYNKKKCLFHG